MPGHTPEERAKNDAARSIQPGPDRQGGSAAVSNDAGSKSRVSKWRKFLQQPEVVAGLLQFSVQMLQTNPGGFGPAFGTSVAAGLGAAGRVSKLNRELGESRGESEALATQQDLENALAERKQIEVEKRTEILGRPRVGRGGKGKEEISRQTTWENFFRGDPLPGEPVVDPGTVTRLGRAAAAAEVDIDGDIMALASAAGISPRDAAEAYSNSQTRRDLKSRLGLGLESIVSGGGATDPETSKVVPGARTPTVTKEPGESDEAFSTRKKKRDVTETTRVDTLSTQDEAQRLAVDTKNRQDQVRSRIKEELASGRNSEEEIADILIALGFRDQVSLDLLRAEFPGLWDIVTRKLTGG